MLVNTTIGGPDVAASGHGTPVRARTSSMKALPGIIRPARTCF